MKNFRNLSLTLTRASFVALLFFSLCTLAAAERREHIVSTWRPLNYDVTLVFNDQLTELTRARTVITIQALKDSVTLLDLDFGEMTVDSVTVNGTPARYKQIEGRLNISLAQGTKRDAPLSVAVDYHGRPKDGLMLTPDKDGKASAVGDNWPNRVHHWIPCLDHPSAKATVQFSITAPQRDEVVANGRLDARTSNPDTTRTWTYTESVPIPPYCMIVAVGEFERREPLTPAVTPLYYYVPDSDVKYARQGFGPATPALAFFSETVAPYPYEKLALIVGATRFGGMENSSAIVFTSTLFDEPREAVQYSRRFNVKRSIEDVVAHEIAHQWFGDSVTESTWADLWLSEGFATYFAGLFIERYEGRAAFQDYMRRAAETYFKYEQRARSPIHDRDTEDLFKLLNANNYQKGAWVLHMLRGVMGDAAFFRGLREYYSAHRNSTATTEDLRAALEKSSKLDLKDFFQRWVYESGHPRYEAIWSWKGTGKTKGGTLTVTLRQLQDDVPFLMTLPVDISTSSGRLVHSFIKPTGKETITRIQLNSPPTDIKLDPNDSILKEATVREAR